VGLGTAGSNTLILPPGSNQITTLDRCIKFSLEAPNVV